MLSVTNEMTVLIEELSWQRKQLIEVLNEVHDMVASKDFEEAQAVTERIQICLKMLEDTEESHE